MVQVFEIILTKLGPKKQKKKPEGGVQTEHLPHCLLYGWGFFGQIQLCWATQSPPFNL